MKLLLYCTKAKPYLYDLRYIFGTFCGCKAKQNHFENLLLNGKIVAECDFEVEEIFEDNFEDARDGYVEHFYTLKSYDDFDEGQEALLKKSCLQKHELSNYLGFENGYAIHIKNLHIFDKPRFIQDYSKNENPYNYIENAPQNMMYAYDVKSFEYYEKYILISIRPEWLCKILNGEKTIECRKRILKEMLKNE